VQGKNHTQTKKMPSPAITISTCFLGRIDYKKAWDLQRAWRYWRQRHVLGDVLILAEHPPTYTLGRATATEHLPDGEAALRHGGAAVHRVERGGSATFHGPGQLVGYPILDLRAWDRDVHAYMRRLEDVLTDTLAHWGLSGQRRPGLSGVWCGPVKMAAIGVHLRSWVTLHGFSLNIDPDLDAFSAIRPCGLQPAQIGSMAQKLKDPPGLAEASTVLSRLFAQHFDRQATLLTSHALEAQLASMPAIEPGEA
jgi:lipoate-protein ligase B